MTQQRVRGHARYTASGKTRVRSHSRNAEAWREAGRTWALTAATGATSVALVLNTGFQLVSTLAIIVTAILTVAAGRDTARAARGPQPRKAASTGRPTSKPKASSRGGTGALWQHIERKQARRRARYRKWKKRGKKAYKVSRKVAVGTGRVGHGAYRRGKAVYLRWRANRSG